MTVPTKRRAIHTLLDLYRSFCTLNFTLLAAGAAALWFSGMLEPERIRHAAEIVKRGVPEAPAEELPPDYAAWRDLASLEARSEFLEKKYWRLDDERKGLERERELLASKTTLESQALAKLKKEIADSKKALDAAGEGFASAKKAWEDSTGDESFQTQVQVYLGMKEDRLAELLLAKRGMDGDLAIVRVMRAVVETNPKKASKLVDAMLANETGGTRRVLGVLKLWLEGKVSDDELARAAAEAQPGAQPKNY